MGGVGKFTVLGFRNHLKQKQSAFHGVVSRLKAIKGGEVGIELESREGGLSFRSVKFTGLAQIYKPNWHGLVPRDSTTLYTALRNGEASQELCEVSLVNFLVFYMGIYNGISIHLLLSIPASARELICQWKAAALSAIELSVSQ